MIKIRSYYYDFKEGIKNIIKWIPVIWKDRQWDQYYFYKILYHKLKCMEEFYNSDNVYSTEAPKITKQIKVAKNLTKRLMDEKYLDNALMWHEQKYPDYLEKAWNFIEIKDKRNVWRWVNNNSKNEQDSFQRCCKHSDYMEKQDREMLFDLIKTHINKWWD